MKLKPIILLKLGCPKCKRELVNLGYAAICRYCGYEYTLKDGFKPFKEERDLKYRELKKFIFDQVKVGCGFQTRKGTNCNCKNTKKPCEYNSCYERVTKVIRACFDTFNNMR